LLWSASVFKWDTADYRNFLTPSKLRSGYLPFLSESERGRVWSIGYCNSLIAQGLEWSHKRLCALTTECIVSQKKGSSNKKLNDLSSSSLGWRTWNWFEWYAQSRWLIFMPNLFQISEKSGIAFGSAAGCGDIEIPAFVFWFCVQFASELLHDQKKGIWRGQESVCSEIVGSWKGMLSWVQRSLISLGYSHWWKSWSEEFNRIGVTGPRIQFSVGTCWVKSALCTNAVPSTEVFDLQYLHVGGILELDNWITCF
jgi:hypothetical protein